MTAGELFTACGRSYLIARGADAHVLAAAGGAYLMELYGDLLTHHAVAEPVYAYMAEDPDKPVSSLQRQRQQALLTAGVRLEKTADPLRLEDAGTMMQFFETNYFNGESERSPEGHDMLTWREMEVLYGVSTTMADMDRVVRKFSTLPQYLFRLYVAVLDYTRGGTRLPKLDMPVEAPRAIWLQEVCDLFNRCYTTEGA